MKIAITGAQGFLGRHTRLRLSALTDHEVVPVTRENWGELSSLLADADAVIHLAGVNRASTNDLVERGNEDLGSELAQAIRTACRPLRIVMSGTIQVGRDNAYGRGKQKALDIVQAAVSETGGQFVDVCLPNLFGEHARPDYNSFIATFTDRLINGGHPTINDNEVELLHAQDAAQALIDALLSPESRIRPRGYKTKVTSVWSMLEEFHRCYVPNGELPRLDSKFRIDLFNTYRSALFPEHYPIRLTPHTDVRGTFVETVRSRGGEGQSSISTTVPGVTRGEHYHLSKIERFAVVQGEARISLRRKFSTEVLSFDVSGEEPVAIDMPVGWVHNITNSGDSVLITQFWSHELYRPDAPDTFPEPVAPIVRS